MAFTGDGGFLMAVAELQTAVRENLPIIVVVFDDEEIGLIRVKQEIKGIPLARREARRHGLGAARARLRRRRRHRRERERASATRCKVPLRSGRTTVIGVKIDASGYVAQFNALREL